MRFINMSSPLISGSTKKSSVFLILLISLQFEIHGQTIEWKDEKLNTAKGASYMKPKEREMIYELNRLRSDPPRYAKLFIKNLLYAAAPDTTVKSGTTQYSVSYTYENNKVIRTDTTWQDAFKENYKALKTLYDTLLKMKPLPILQPDKGIYMACINHGKDQSPLGRVDHQGTDGKWPWDRIKNASPKMFTGNENIACGPDNVRAIVLQLVIDSGISNYGHRYNMLNPTWTHVACYEVGKLDLACQYWIQNFGIQKINVDK